MRHLRASRAGPEPGAQSSAGPARDPGAPHDGRAAPVQSEPRTVPSAFLPRRSKHQMLLSPQASARKLRESPPLIPAVRSGAKLGLESRTPLRATCSRFVLANRGTSDDYKLALGGVRRPELEPQHGAGLERRGQSLEGASVRRVLTALDAGDDGGGRIHSPSELGLRDAQRGAAHVDDARERLERREPFVLSAVVGVEPSRSVSSRRKTAW